MLARVGGVVLVAGAALVLSGCTVIGSLGDKAQIDLGLASLSTDLKEIDGVTDVTSTAKITGDYHYEIAVTATGGTISDAALKQIADLALERLGGGVFEKEQVSFTLQVPAGLLFGLNDWTLDTKTLDEQLEYRAAFAAAYGAQVSIDFAPAFQDQPRTRQIGALAVSHTADWDAIRALPDTWTDMRYWGLGYIDAMETLPGPEVTDLADAVAQLDLPDDFWIAVTGWRDSVGIDVSYPALKSATLTSSEEWPLVLAIAKLVASTEFSTPSLGLSGDGFSAYAFFGDCDTDVESYFAGNEALLAEALGAGWHAGACPPQA